MTATHVTQLPTPVLAGVASYSGTFAAWRWWEATVKTKINVHSTADLVNTMRHQLIVLIKPGEEGFIIEESRLERIVSLLST